MLPIINAWLLLAAALSPMGGGCSAARLGAYHSRRTRRLLKQPPMQPGNTTSPCCCISFHREHFHRGTRVSQERLAFKAVGVGLPRGALHSASQQGCRSLKNGRSLPRKGVAALIHPQPSVWQALNSTVSRRRRRLALSLLHAPSSDTCATPTQACALRCLCPAHARTAALVSVLGRALGLALVARV